MSFNGESFSSESSTSSQEREIDSTEKTSEYVQDATIDIDEGTLELASNFEKMRENEAKVVERYNLSELSSQYSDDTEVSAQKVEESVADFIQEKGIVNARMEADAAADGQQKEKEAKPELSKEDLESVLNPESADKIMKVLEERIDFHFPEKEKYRGHKEKVDKLLKESSAYLNLLIKAMGEKDISGITGADAFELVQNNIDIMAYQDRKATETSIGDHGIRHITYNIDMCDQIYDKLAPNQKMTAMDQLIAHQAMIMHDVGYTTKPVAEAGPGHDKGHSTLSAKIAGEQINNPDNVLSKVFKGENALILHNSILKHDSNVVDFDLENRNGSEEGRRNRIESAIHFADNSHAFDSKLPEMLYTVPETHEALVLLKSASETGSTEDFDKIKQQLIDQIYAREDIAPDDKIALSKAVDQLSGESFSFNAPRLCGKNPEITEISKDGKIKMTIEESKVQQEVISTFGIKEFKQLKKLISDITGLDLKDKEQGRLIESALYDETTSNVVSFNNFEITLLSPDKTDKLGESQKNMEIAFSDDKISHFIQQELVDNNRQKAIILRLETDKGLSDDDRARLNGKIREISENRIKRRNALMEERQKGIR